MVRWVYGEVSYQPRTPANEWVPVDAFRCWHPPAPCRHKHFHIYHKEDTVLAISQVQQSGQTVDQKVVFKSSLLEKQICKLVDRHDSMGHYRGMEFRVNGPAVLATLTNTTTIPTPKLARLQVTTYGRAVRLRI